MGERTTISWTQSTWNPWIGCRKVSPGCAHCYAETLVQRMGKSFREIRRAQATTFFAPLRWKSPRRVFSCSISDFFIEEADAWRDEAWEIIRKTPRHTYQILTKRPERIHDHLPTTCFKCGVGPYGAHVRMEIEFRESHGFKGWPWKNVWLGTSVENQKYAELRVPRLVSTLAVVHFLSCEPLLGSIDFGIKYLASERAGTALRSNGLLSDIEWVICGGESGPEFRPMNLDWARSIRDQSLAAEVPFFFKQSSGQRSEMHPVLDGREWREMPLNG